MDNNNITPINKKQILLDWINTIDEPSCLLVSQVDQLLDGRVYLEILKNYLKNFHLNIYNTCKEEFSYMESSCVKDRFDFINNILKEFYDEELIDNFPYELIIENENVLIEYIQVLKELYEHNPKKNSNINKKHINYKEKNFQFNKTFQTEVTERKNDFSYEDKPNKLVKIKNIIKTNKIKEEKINKQDRPKTLPKTFINTYSRENNNDCKSLSRSDISNTSNNDKSCDRSRSYSNTSIITVDKIDFNKVYSKREKAELYLSRGIAKEYKKYETNLQKCIFYQFIRPTEIIVETDRQYYNKYKPSLEFFKNNIISNKTYIKPSTPDISLTCSNNSKKERSKDIDISKKQRILDDKPYIIHELNINNDGISLALKNKLYFWITDLNIFKENAIRCDDLPKICCNGVLLADLVNRLEGKTESIKGIIRKTTTKSHIQVNINKVLEYLRNIGKFSTRHLWSNNEISKGDPKVIWELLEDMWNYYTSKNIPNQEMKLKKVQSFQISRNNSKSNINNTETKKNMSINNITRISRTNTEDNLLFTKEKNNIENIYTNDKTFENYVQDVSYRKVVVSNVSNLMKNKSARNSPNNKIIQKCLGINKSYRKNNLSEIKSPDSNISTIESRRRNNSKTNMTLQTNRSKEREHKENNCFILFQKSNIKKLKDEINKIESMKIQSDCKEDTVYVTETLQNNEEKSSTPNEKIVTTPRIKITQRNYEIKTNEEKDEDFLKEYLLKLGLSEAKNVNFKQDEIHEFKNGLLLTKLISILENRKISGINNNPRSSVASIKNITKCLEILRTKKDMPFDYLWSEDEISRGNGAIIRPLLKQIIKVYEKEISFVK